MAQVAQQVEHLLGKEEVIGSSPILSSTFFYNKKHDMELRKFQEEKWQKKNSYVPSRT
jgi:hypothetical protein